MKFLTKYRWIITAVAVTAVFAVVYMNLNSSKSISSQSTIKKVVDSNEFKSILDSAGSRLLVFDLYADWCAPCKMIEPTLASLSETYKGKVDFYRVNVDENAAIANTFKTQVIPYVVFVKNGKVVKAISGVSSQGAYEKVITACAESSEDCTQVVQNF